MLQKLQLEYKVYIKIVQKTNKILIFLIPIFFGLPNISISTSVINLRADDIIVYLLFFLNLKILVKWKILLKYNSFYSIIRFLIFWYFVTIIKALLFEYELSSYELSKSFGSLPYLLILPLLLIQNSLRKLFYNGALIGFILFIYGVYKNYSTSILTMSSLERSSDLKTSLSFTTLNPNAIALIAFIFSFILLLGFAELKKKHFLVLGIIGLTIPFITLSRGMSSGVLISFIIFIIFRRKKKFQSILIVVFLGILAIKSIDLDNSLIASAIDVDVSTGKGFSNRYTLWGQGIDLVIENPIMGSGFSTIEYMYNTYFFGHMSHNILIHYTVELGIIGLFIFLLMIRNMLIEKIYLYKNTNNEFYLIQLSLLIGVFIADMSSQDLYFNKYALLIFILSSLKYEKVSTKNKNTKILKNK